MLPTPVNGSVPAARAVLLERTGRRAASPELHCATPLNPSFRCDGWVVARRESQRDQESRAETPSVDLAACVSGLMNAVILGAGEELQPYGLSLIEYSVLRLCLQEKETTATDLADSLPVDASRISRIVTGLVEQGLLVRRRLRRDRRIVMLRLSEDGVALASKLLQEMEAYEGKLTEGIGGEEMRTFADVTSKMVANHGAMKA